jgi:4-diphosphocytidyl-2-C-methyl-D-erythritol kinase
VAPRVDVSTCKAFGLLAAPSLTKSDSKSILQICRLEARELNLRQSGLKNDFENAVFTIEPEIERVKKKLFDLGAKHALMSGSGASVFAVFDGKEKLESAIDVLKFEETWRVFPVQTVSREDYLESLSLVRNFLQ